MKILIVEDYEALRELLVHMVRNQSDRIEVLEAGTLDEARELLPQADAVLCDSSFPTHGRDFEPLVKSAGNWAPVHMDAERAGTPFVLLSGNSSLVRRLKERGIEAFEKPGGARSAVRRVAWLAEQRHLRLAGL